jgi:MinD superfamily P-loop ATPase
MIISVASGKGGTGKTTVATNLALSLTDDVQFLDCDVEEPNAHFFIKPDIEKTEKISILVPEIDKAKCTFCGKCQKVCAYNTIAVISPNKETTPTGNVLVFAELCHGCGSCAYFCPKDAIKEIDREVGIIEKGRKGNLEFIHGKLNIGEAMAPPLIRAVKKQIRPDKTVIIDAPPGTSCPVIASIKESHFCVLVTEPTPFGLYDLTLAVDVLRKLKISFGVVVNRSGLGDESVDRFCSKENIPILMKIPFSREIAAAYSKGDTIIDALPQYKEIFYSLFENIKTHII